MATAEGIKSNRQINPAPHDFISDAFSSEHVTLQDLPPAFYHNQDSKKSLVAKPTAKSSSSAQHSTNIQIPLLHPSTWLYEVLSLVLSALALVALVAILALYNGKPNPQWVGGSITLNTIVSFTSTVFRLSLLVPLGNCISQLSWTWFSKRERLLYHMALLTRLAEEQLRFYSRCLSSNPTGESDCNLLRGR